MSVVGKVGWRMANLMAHRLSTYHLHRLAALFVEQARPKQERQSYQCPICQYEGPMKPFFGAKAVRYDAHCPSCGSRERHRFLKLWMDTDPRGASFGDLVHFAPENELIALLRARAQSYRTADIEPGRADLVLNLEEIDLPDASVDVVMANHVLEHVDHEKALREIRRILRPGGFAILTTPVIAAWLQSYCDPDIRGAAAQYRHFGQQDHVIYFGRDIEDHIRAAGLVLEIISADGAQSARHALIPGDTIYIATRPAD